jgi:hypothetical protein
MKVLKRKLKCEMNRELKVEMKMVVQGTGLHCVALLNSAKSA